MTHAICDTVEEDATGVWADRAKRCGAFRSRLLTQLVSRASQNAVHVLFAMQRKFPDDVNLKSALADASYAQRELSWRPIEPAALFQLPRFPRRRIVQSSTTSASSSRSSTYWSSCWYSSTTMSNLCMGNRQRFAT